MSILRTVIRNIASNWLGIAVHVLVSLFLAPFVVNALGSLYYGIWALTMQLTGYMYVLDLGIRESVIRYVARYRSLTQPKKISQLLSVALSAYLPIAAVGVLATAFGVVGLPHWFVIADAQVYEARVALALVGLMLVQGLLFNAFTGVLQGLQRFDLSNLIGVFSELARAVLIVIVLRAGHGIVGLALVQLGLSLIGNLVLAYLAMRSLRDENLYVPLAVVTGRRWRAWARRIMNYSSYIFINNVASKVIIGTDAVVIGIFLPVAAVTYYAIAANLVGLLRGVVAASVWVMMPLVSHYASLRRFEDVRTLLVRASKLALLVALPVCAGFIVVGHDFIRLWMGDEFAPQASAVLTILAVAEIFSAPHHAMSTVLYGLNRHRLMAAIRVTEAVANLLLSIWLVRRIGLAGVALGTMVPHVLVMLVVLPVLVCRVTGMSVGRYFAEVYWPPLAPAAVFLTGALGVRYVVLPTNLVQFFLAVGLVLSLYVLMAYWLALGAQERATLREYVRATLRKH